MKKYKLYVNEKYGDHRCYEYAGTFNSQEELYKAIAKERRYMENYLGGDTLEFTIEESADDFSEAEDQEKSIPKTAEELLKTAEQYEAQAKALREEAAKKSAPFKMKVDEKEHVFVVTANGSETLFVDKRDAETFKYVLTSNGVDENSIKIEVKDLMKKVYFYR